MHGILDTSKDVQTATIHTDDARAALQEAADISRDPPMTFTVKLIAGTKPSGPQLRTCADNLTSESYTSDLFVSLGSQLKAQ